MSNPPFNNPPFGGQQYNKDEQPQQPAFGGQQPQGRPNGFPPQQSQGFPQQPQQGGFPQQGQQNGGFPPQNNGFPPQPQQGGFPQQGQPNQFPPAQQNGGFPPQNNGFPPQPQQGGFPQQGPNGGFPPQMPNGGFPPQNNGFPPQGPNGGFNQAPQNNGKGNKKLFIILAAVVGGLALLIGLVAVVAGFLGGGDEQNNADVTPSISEPAVDPAQPINLDPVESTGNAQNDQAFNDTYELLNITTFDVNSARGVALDTCSYLATNPSAPDFQRAIEVSGDDHFEIGKAIGAGMAIYCPSENDKFYELLEA